jgi:hypothetical protein
VVNKGCKECDAGGFTRLVRGEAIKLLRENGADVNLPNKHGVAPVALARSIANFDVMRHFAK